MVNSQGCKTVKGKSNTVKTLVFTQHHRSVLRSVSGFLGSPKSTCKTHRGIAATQQASHTIQKLGKMESLPPSSFQRRRSEQLLHDLGFCCGPRAPTLVQGSTQLVQSLCVAERRPTARRRWGLRRWQKTEKMEVLG